MFLSRTYATRPEIPKGAAELYHKQGTLFILTGAKRDFVADNPWEADGWNLTMQGRFIAAHGMEIATAFAKVAGTKVGGLKPSLPKPDPIKVLIQKRVIGSVSVGSNDSGSSGDGPPTT